MPALANPINIIPIPTQYVSVEKFSVIFMTSPIKKTITETSIPMIDFNTNKTTKEHNISFHNENKNIILTNFIFTDL